MIRYQTRFVERDDPFVVGWGRGKPLQKRFDKHRPRRVQEADPLVDLGKLHADRLAIEWHGLTRVPRQDERLRWQREQLLQAVVERGGARPRFLLISVQVSTAVTGRQHGATRQEDG